MRSPLRPLSFVPVFLLLIVLPHQSQAGFAQARLFEAVFAEPSNGTADSFGESIANAGDTDGDGFKDLIVGASGAGYAKVFSGFDSSVLHVLTGVGSKFGKKVETAGDVNNDGYDDFIVCSSSDSDSSLEIVTVFSGIDASVLYRVRHSDFPAHNLLNFGDEVIPVGDLDNDQHDDIAVYAEFANGITYGSRGKIMVISSASALNGGSAELIFEIEGTTWEKYGKAMAPLWSDINGDGYNDFVIGVPQAGGGFGSTDRGYIDIVSGKPGSQTSLLGHPIGKILYRGVSPTPDLGFGLEVANIGDLDNDGKNDVAVGAPQTDGGTGAVYVYSSAGLSILDELRPFYWSPQYHGSRFGEHISTLPKGELNEMDFDGEGSLDLIFLVGAPSYDHKYWDGFQIVQEDNAGGFMIMMGNPGSPYVWMHDFISQTSPSHPDMAGYRAQYLDYFGRGVAMLSFPWFSVSSPFDHELTGSLDGGVYVFDFGSENLRVNRTEVSVSEINQEAQTIRFIVNPGKDHAGEEFWLLGTTMGTAPGIPIGLSNNLPINFDTTYSPAFFQHSSYFGTPNEAVENMGIIGNNGRGEARLTISPPLSQLWGNVELHHAYFTHNGMWALTTSEPKKLTLTP